MELVLLGRMLFRVVVIRALGDAENDVHAEAETEPHKETLHEINCKFTKLDHQQSYNCLGQPLFISLVDLGTSSLLEVGEPAETK